MSISEATVKQYSGPLSHWRLFCKEARLDPYIVKDDTVIRFLSKKLQEGASYGTLNSARSALSLISQGAVNSPNMSRFFKGVYRMRPPQPKYDTTWDIEVVFREIEKWYPLEDLNLQKLTERLIILLAIGTAHRIQTFSKIKLVDINHTSKGYQIKISSPIKTSRKGAYQPLLDLPYFDENPKLCVAKTLQRYISVTQSLRGACGTLLVTTKSPYKAASNATISRWIRSVLYTCGISPEYTAHSTRHASTSAASKKGISIHVIKKTAGWSERSEVFARHYQRVIVQGEESFATSIFRKS